MQNSDDEDSFQSADEDGFDHSPPGSRKSSTSSSGSERGHAEKSLDKDANQRSSRKLKNTQHQSSKIIHDAEHREPSQTDDDDDDDDDRSTDTERESIGKSGAKIGESMANKHLSDAKKIVEPKDQEDEDKKNEEEKDMENDDDDDEEALAERIRERNLRIARKFSAEIAKNNKASAPVPIKSSVPIGFKVNDIDYPSLSGVDTKSGLPPAPPPTPASFSSFNNLTEETRQPSEPTMKTQYGWRLPPKTGAVSQPGTPKMVDSPSCDQARQALDRLAANVSHSDKGLFEGLTAELKKVSIKSDDPVVPDLAASAPTLPSISDLGSTLGGWGWTGASRLLSSASQVTSQVGAVLDTVVNVSQHLQQQSDNSNATGANNNDTNNYGLTTTTTTKTSSDTQPNVSKISSDEAPTKTTDSSIIKPKQSTTTTTTTSTTSSDKQGSVKIENNAADSSESDLPGDPLVDFTLNAMESLGKKAFNVMTERDQSGSIHIKGLGRPWEHLKKFNWLEKDGYDGTAASSKPRDAREFHETIERNLDEGQTSSSFDNVIDKSGGGGGGGASYKSKAVCDDASRPTTVRNRKRCNLNDDDDLR